jgi:tRNA nucleotidyltransferase (CCA-adding enzyme)
VKISKHKLKKALSSPVLQKVTQIGNICSRYGASCYLVGGTVRDLILGVSQVDVDIVTADLTWVQNIPKKFLKKIITSQFNTKKLVFKNGYSIDIAQSRKEKYPSPSSLPVVEPGSFVEDVLRRDFTINTLLLDISEENFGKIVDYIGGLEDIKKGVIRVLHDKSFTDDPTRIFRAIRFKERFSFRYDRKTKHLMKEVLEKKFIAGLSPQRIRRELFLILGEEKWRKMVLQLERYTILKQLGLRGGCIPHNLRSLERILEGSRLKKRNYNTVKLLLLSHHSSKKDIETFSERVGLRKNERSILIDMRKRSRRLIKSLSGKELKDTDLYWVLHPIPPEGILYLMSISTPSAKRKIRYYLDRLREIKPHITGSTIKRMGIKEGPLYKKILKEITNGIINGRIKTKSDEIEFCKKMKEKITL